VTRHESTKNHRNKMTSYSVGIVKIWMLGVIVAVDAVDAVIVVVIIIIRLNKTWTVVLVLKKSE
jgi:hypothetical protein